MSAYASFETPGSFQDEAESRHLWRSKQKTGDSAGGYASHKFREYLWSRGSRPVIPPRKNDPDGLTATGICSKTYGQRSRNGGLLRPDMRRPPRLSSPSSSSQLYQDLTGPELEGQFYTQQNSH